MSTCLPEEIIFDEILLRRVTLSIKCWIRLTLVCKRWLSLITKPGPINSLIVHSLYLNNNSNTCEATSLVFHTRNKTYPDTTVFGNNNSVFYKFNDSVVKICVQIFGLDPCFLEVESYRHAAGAVHVKLIDSVNGLVCFSHAYAQRVLFIWNPVTSLFTTVYKPSVVLSETILNEDSVFYYDPVRRDVKIMHIELLYSMENRNSIRVHVYSFNAGVWREIKDDTLPRTHFKTMRNVKSRRPVYLQFGSSELVAFDFDNEVFKRLPYFSSDHYINWMGSLCKVGHNYSGEQVIYALDESNGTWLEKCIVPLSLQGDELKLILSNGEFIFQTRYGSLILLKDYQSCWRMTPINLKSQRSGCLDVIPYTESLLCVKGMQDLKKMETRKELCNLRKKIRR